MSVNQAERGDAYALDSSGPLMYFCKLKLKMTLSGCICLKQSERRKGRLITPISGLQEGLSLKQTQAQRTI